MSESVELLKPASLFAPYGGFIDDVGCAAAVVPPSNPILCRLALRFPRRWRDFWKASSCALKFELLFSELSVLVTGNVVVVVNVGQVGKAVVLGPVVFELESWRCVGGM